MSYDDVEIEDMEWNDDLGAYTYPCPCGDLFQITKVFHSAFPSKYPNNIHQLAACSRKEVFVGGACCWGRIREVSKLLTVYHCCVRPGKLH